MYIVQLDDPGSIMCANCNATWRMSLFQPNFSRAAMRQLGFAYISFDGAIAINQCPHCELQRGQSEAPPWPNSLPC